MLLVNGLNKTAETVALSQLLSQLRAGQHVSF